MINYRKSWKFLDIRKEEEGVSGAVQVAYGNYGNLLAFWRKPLQIEVRLRTYTIFSGRLKRKLNFSCSSEAAKSVPEAEKFALDPLTLLKDFS